MDRNGNGFQYQKDRFGKTQTDTKLKAEIFVGPEIHEMMRDDTFRSKLNMLEFAAWLSCQTSG